MARFQYTGDNSLSNLRFFNRCVAFLIYTDAIGYLYSQEIPLHLVPTQYQSLVGRFTLLLFFTQWNLMIHVFFFGLCLITDFFPQIKTNKITKFLDFIYNGFMVSMTSGVSFIFWSIWMVDPNLILPEIIRQIVPAWYNHVAHTFIVPFALIEGITTEYRLTKLSTSIKAFVSISIAYSILITYIGQTYGWGYPIFEILPLYLKVGFKACCILLGVSFLVIYYKMKDLIRRPQSNENDYCVEKSD